MIFGDRRINHQPQVQIEGVRIERVHEIKFLGVMINDKICWNTHIKYICTKISRSISVMAKARNFLDNKSPHILFCSLVLRNLNYCTEMWGNTYKSSLEPLLKLQKSALEIKFIIIIDIIKKTHQNNFNASYLEHTNPLFIKSKIIKLNDVVEFQTAQFLYKTRNYLLLSNLQKMFHEREGRYDLREQFNFKIQRYRTTIKKFCITNTGVRLRNGLSVDLKQCQSINQLKNKYKHRTFARYKEEET